MSFANKLKDARRVRGLSQEELAEQLDVSRQAVGKWEQGVAYPEVEKLLTLCSVLHVSLDALMADELPQGCRSAGSAPAQSILILDEKGTNLVRCVNFLCSQPYKTRRGPRYSLHGVSDTRPYQVGNTHLLGWYADEASVRQELKAIHEAMRRGDPDYTLQYNVRARRRLGRMEIVNE